MDEARVCMGRSTKMQQDGKQEIQLHIEPEIMVQAIPRA